MSKTNPIKWYAAGDLNAFFGLMLDNVTNLVLLTTILVTFFDFPKQFIYTYMIPGTALGVLVGDCIYTWLAIRLGKRTGRSDITAMPLGLDTPSTIGVSVAIIGPVYSVGQDPWAAWQVGMATMIFIGILKLALSFAGDWIRNMVPKAGLLGSLAGIGIALLGFFPLTHLFRTPIIGMVALGIVLATLVAKLPFPKKLPAAAVSVIVATSLYYLLGPLGLLGDSYHHATISAGWTLPVPTLGFLHGLEKAYEYLPLAIPFGLLTVVGGINVTESASVAGDRYETKSILLTEALSTLVAGLTGGVAQTTPYIGHPAYKAMGGRAGYTLACGLFIGVGGALGFISSIVELLPAAAVVPILLFVGLEIVSQAFKTCREEHYPALALAFLPIVANLVLIQWKTFLGSNLDNLDPSRLTDYMVIAALGNGFILTSMLWGSVGAKLVDKNIKNTVVFLVLCALLSLFGVIHSVFPNGNLYLPWTIDSTMPIQIAVGYLAFAFFLLLLLIWRPKPVDPINKVDT